MSTTKVIMKRKIVEIDETKCNGCGQCIPNCREGALAIVDGKAKLVKDQFCDGLGACLGHCPQDAIRIIEREAEVFDEAATEEHLKQAAVRKKAAPVPHAGCPSSRAIFMTERLQKGKVDGASTRSANRAVSNLANWPVQLMLVPVEAPYFKGSDLLIAADCVGFSLPDFHGLLEGKVLIVACPKLDDTDVYSDKLAQIFAANDIRSVTVAHMEVPCCFGLKMLIEDAMERSGKNIELKDITITIEGKVRG